jgi:hypothetical protein
MRRTRKKTAMAARAASGRGDQEDAKAGGHAFAAFEAEPDGEHVAEDGEEGGEGLHVAAGMRGAEQAPSRAPSQTAEQPLSMSRGRWRAQALAAGAEDVGGADVAAADGADVLVAEDADQQVAGGDGAEQVSGGRDEEACEEHAERHGAVVGFEVVVSFGQAFDCFADKDGFAVEFIEEKLAEGEGLRGGNFTVLVFECEGFGGHGVDLL